MNCCCSLLDSSRGWACSRACWVATTTLTTTALISTTSLLAARTPCLRRSADPAVPNAESRLPAQEADCSLCATLTLRPFATEIPAVLCGTGLDLTESLLPTSSNSDSTILFGPAWRADRAVLGTAYSDLTECPQTRDSGARSGHRGCVRGRALGRSGGTPDAACRTGRPKALGLLRHRRATGTSSPVELSRSRPGSGDRIHQLP